MTPDFKRLCEAAEAVEYSYQENLRPAEAEAVVRAVLMALKEPSEGALKAARLRLYRYRHNDEPDVLDTNPMAWEAMLGHILGEPLKGDPVGED